MPAATLLLVTIAGCGRSGPVTATSVPAHRTVCSNPGSSTAVDQGAVFGAAGLSWRVAFNGFGQVEQTARSGAACITLTPARPALPTDSHSALVVSVRSWKDLTAEFRVRTNQQTRSPNPNPWEVGWIVWHYTDDQHFYYVILKPNGWELGKEEPGNHRVLDTGQKVVFPTGRWYAVTVEQRGDVITVTVGGDRVVRFTDTDSPYQSGHVGLYAADSSSTYEPLAIRAAAQPQNGGA